MTVAPHRINLTSATILSGVYLTAGVGIELVRRYFGFRWAERASLALEVFPARILDWLGLFVSFRKAWAQGILSDIQVRLLYGLTTIAVIYVLGFLVALAMWTATRWWPRKTS